MTWPLDVFEASVDDAVAFFNAEHGTPDPGRKLRDKAKEVKERIRARAGIAAPWWV